MWGMVRGRGEGVAGRQGIAAMAETGDPDREDAVLRRQATAMILVLTSGDATRADVAAAKQWRQRSPRHEAAFAEAQACWHVSGEALARVAGRECGGPVQPVAEDRRTTRRALLGGAFAASAAATAAVMVRPPLHLWPSTSELAADHRTGTGERRQIGLAGGVALHLNTQTSVNVDQSAEAHARIQLIAGEAAVTTAGRAVEVMAGSGRAWAENAHFTVRATSETTSIACLSGTVRVACAGQSVTLAAAQTISYQAQSLGSASAVDATRAQAWLEGDLVFQDEPLTRVIDEVNRYRPGRIILMNAELGQRRITAHFRIDQLDVVIPQLRGTFGARATVLPGGVVFVS